MKKFKVAMLAATFFIPFIGVAIAMRSPVAYKTWFVYLFMYVQFLYGAYIVAWIGATYFSCYIEQFFDWFFYSFIHGT